VQRGTPRGTAPPKEAVSESEAADWFETSVKAGSMEELEALPRGADLEGVTARGTLGDEGSKHILSKEFLFVIITMSI